MGDQVCHNPCNAGGELFALDYRFWIARQFLAQSLIMRDTIYKLLNLLLFHEDSFPFFAVQADNSGLLHKRGFCEPQKQKRNPGTEIDRMRVMHPATLIMLPVQVTL
jgi:hypothetical protein